jgi:hypothetical protein
MGEKQEQSGKSAAVATNDDAHREFMLSALRSAALRCKIYECEINSIGVALKAKMIGPSEAILWAKDAGVMELLSRIPQSISGSEVDK